MKLDILGVLNGNGYLATGLVTVVCTWASSTEWLVVWWPLGLHALHALLETIIEKLGINYRVWGHFNLVNA